MRKILINLAVLLSVLFNIQIGLTHDIEHLYHGEEHHENSAECEDCRLNDQSTKTTNFFSSPYDFYCNLKSQFNNHFFIKNSYPLNLVAFQSRAP